MRRLTAIAGGVVALIYGCGGPPHSTTSQPPALPPLAVVVDTVIEGRILGQILRGPSGVVVDAQNNLIVCDAGNNRVIRFNPTFVPEREIGGYGSQPGLFNKPTFIALDGSMGLRVVDQGNRRVCRLDSRLQYVDEITFSDNDDPLKFGAPAGVAVDRPGYIWVTDRELSRIAVFDAVQQFNRFIGEFGYSGGALLSPEKVIVTGAGDHVVCDPGNKRVVVYDDYGNFVRDITDPEFQTPSAAAVDPADRLWILDHATGRLFLFTLSGDRLFAVGPDIPGTRTPLVSPADIVVSHDRIFIADGGNNRILVCHGITERE
jgi:DNA-binding beta-propeller fold protein YncE